MIKSKKAQKSIFWEALLIAIFIFASGILLGYLMEQNRTSRILTAYQEAEINLLDIQIQKDIISSKNIDCEQAIRETLNFADRTYEEAQILEDYKESARLSEGILFQYKKYSLLRTILWINSVKIKQACPGRLHTIVYFNEMILDKLEDSELVARQRTFSQYLFELKKKYGDKVILIPISSNLEVNAVNLLKSAYGIGKSPAVLVDESLKIYEVSQLDEIENLLM